MVKFGDFGKDPECKVVVQNYSETVCGSEFEYRFSSNFSEDTVVYSKTNVAVIVNVKTGEAFHAVCELSMDDYLLGIRFLDPQKDLFVVVMSICDDTGVRHDYLHIVKLDGQQLVDTNWSMPIGETKYILPEFQLYHTETGMLSVSSDTHRKSSQQTHILLLFRSPPLIGNTHIFLTLIIW